MAVVIILHEYMKAVGYIFYFVNQMQESLLPHSKDDQRLAMILMSVTVIPIYIIVGKHVTIP